MLGSDTTKPDGSYKITTPSDPETFNINVRSPDPRTYDPAGRYGVKRATTEMGLDTIGLTNKKSGNKDRLEKDHHVRNTVGYVRAGGDPETAQQAVRDACMRFDGYISTAKQLGLENAFEERRIPFPAKP